MELSLVWKTIVTILYGTLILRIAGRKSLAQMTVAQTVVMLAVGTVLIEPLVGSELDSTFVVVTLAVFTLIFMEYAELRIPFLKKVFTGKPVLLIEDGVIRKDHLKQVRVTVQQLEMELRQAGIASCEEVRWCTIEPNGKFGFLLKEEFQPLNKQDYRTLWESLRRLEERLAVLEEPLQPKTVVFRDDVFAKVALTDKQRTTGKGDIP